MAAQKVNRASCVRARQSTDKATKKRAKQLAKDFQANLVQLSGIFHVGVDSGSLVVYELPALG